MCARVVARRLSRGVRSHMFFALSTDDGVLMAFRTEVEVLSAANRTMSPMVDGRFSLTMDQRWSRSPRLYDDSSG